MRLHRRQMRDRYVGAGRLFTRDGAPLGRVRYHVQFFQEMIPAGSLEDPHREVSGLIDGQGRIFLEEGANPGGLECTLELDDGRRIDVILDGSVLSTTRAFVTSGELR
jgi:hypothetical protein